MSKVFISYRRQDSPGYVGRLQQTLETRFRRRDVFVDLGDIAPGRDFGQVIGETLGHCKVLIVLIGPYWLTTPMGEPRDLASSGDYVRFEIVAALDRGITLIPVLVGGAKLPTLDQLPVDLRPLLTRQAITLTDVHWAADCKRLMDAIGESVDSPQWRIRAAVADTASIGRKWFRSARLSVATYKTTRVDPVVNRLGKRRLVAALVLAAVVATTWAYISKQNTLTKDMAERYLVADARPSEDGFRLTIKNESNRSFCATVKVDMQVHQGQTKFESVQDFTQTWRAQSEFNVIVPYQKYKGELDLRRAMEWFALDSVKGLCE